VARIDIDQASVLTAVTNRLISQLAIDATHVLEVVDPMHPPDILPSGSIFVSVAIGNGTFPFDEQGIPQLREDTDVEVTGYVRVNLDQPGTDGLFLKHATRGILALKRKILIALAGWDLVDPTSGTDVFLASLMYAKSCSRPNYSSDMGGVGWLTITFGVDFDWDMTL